MAIVAHQGVRQVQYELTLNIETFHRDDPGVLSAADLSVTWSAEQPETGCGVIARTATIHGSGMSRHYAVYACTHPLPPGPVRISVEVVAQVLEGFDGSPVSAAVTGTASVASRSL